MVAATSRTRVRSAEPSSPAGVSAAMKRISPWATPNAASVVNVRRPRRRPFARSSESPGSWVGTMPRSRSATRPASTSTHTTLLPLSAKHAPATSPRRPAPNTVRFMAREPGDFAALAGVEHVIGRAMMSWLAGVGVGQARRANGGAPRCTRRGQMNRNCGAAQRVERSMGRAPADWLPTSASQLPGSGLPEASSAKEFAALLHLRAPNRDRCVDRPFAVLLG